MQPILALAVLTLAAALLHVHLRMNRLESDAREDAAAIRTMRRALAERAYPVVFGEIAESCCCDAQAGVCSFCLSTEDVRQLRGAWDELDGPSVYVCRKCDERHAEQRKQLYAAARRHDYQLGDNLP